MTKGDSEEQIFLSHPHRNNGFFFLLTILNCIFIFKKGFQKFLNTLGDDTTYYHFNITMMSLVDRHRAVQFLSFPRDGMGYAR